MCNAGGCSAFMYKAQTRADAALHLPARWRPPEAFTRRHAITGVERVYILKVEVMSVPSSVVDQAVFLQLLGCKFS